MRLERHERFEGEQLGGDGVRNGRGESDVILFQLTYI